jgi:hypothetical protein
MTLVRTAFICFCLTAASCPRNCTPKAEWIYDVNHSFVYSGKPIPPLIVKDFCCWLSDSEPQIQAIDLKTSVNSNRYYGNVSVENGWVISRSDLDHDAVGYRIMPSDDNHIHLEVVEIPSGQHTLNSKWHLTMHAETWPPLLNHDQTREVLVLDAHD